MGDQSPGDKEVSLPPVKTSGKEEGKESFVTSDHWFSIKCLYTSFLLSSFSLSAIDLN